jgi:Domain of unknown function (DUF4304)
VAPGGVRRACCRTLGAMPTAQERLKALLAEYIAPVMKRHGYRRERNRWGKRVEIRGGARSRKVQKQVDAADGAAALGNGWLVYEVQVSQWSDGGRLSFTVNVGVYSDVLAEFGLWPRPRDRVPAAMYCSYQERIGQLMPSKVDEWWDVHADEDAASVGEAVRAVTEKRVIPHLEGLRLYEKPPDGFLGAWREHAALVLLERGVGACRRWVAEFEAEEEDKREWLKKVEGMGLIGRGRA